MVAIVQEQKPPLVTVVCVTYNHEQFIKQALDSFLMQEASFSYEIIVADDCSSDGTWAILRQYEQAFENIRLYHPDKHSGAEQNIVAACLLASTPYIAMCDGDDYWTDPQKLQKQYEYMETHPEYRACFHDTEIIIENEHPWIFRDDYGNTRDGRLRWCSGNRHFVAKSQYALDEYIPIGFIHSSSMFYRWDNELEIPSWYYSHFLGDYTMWCLQVGTGEFGYIDETMSVYRRWGGSVYEFASRLDFWQKTRRDWISIDQDLLSFFDQGEDAAKIRIALQKRQWSDLRKLLLATLRLNGLKEYRSVLWEYATLVERYSGKSIIDPINNKVTMKGLINAFGITLRYWVGYCLREGRFLYN